MSDCCGIDVGVFGHTVCGDAIPAQRIPERHATWVPVVDLPCWLAPVVGGGDGDVRLIPAAGSVTR